MPEIKRLRNKCIITRESVTVRRGILSRLVDQKFEKPEPKPLAAGEE